MNPLVQAQFDLNRDTQGGWELFANHREKVTRLICGGPMPTRSRLCVLGAGNCNDIDLAASLRAFDEVHLVDLDADALAQGVARQGLAKKAAVHLHGNIDVTGQLAAMAAWASRAILDSDLEACIARPVEQIGAVVPGRFDVVASCCLLSQLIGAVVDTAGEGHPRFRELVQAVRLGHLRLLMHLVAPGGRGMLITDLVSSATAPVLASTAQDRLPRLLRGLIEAGNFFHGVNPTVIGPLLRSEVLNSQAADVAFTDPWLWNLGPRVYAVYAVTMRKGGDGTTGCGE